jgi:hypothetical protein
MLSAVLRSDRAVQMSIAIVRTFVRIRELMVANKDIAARRKTGARPRSHRLGHRGVGRGYRPSGARGRRHEGAAAGDEAAHRVHHRRRETVGKLEVAICAIQIRDRPANKYCPGDVRYRGSSHRSGLKTSNFARQEGSWSPGTAILRARTSLSGCRCLGRSTTPYLSGRPDALPLNTNQVDLA